MRRRGGGHHRRRELPRCRSRTGPAARRGSFYGIRGAASSTATPALPPAGCVTRLFAVTFQPPSRGCVDEWISALSRGNRSPQDVCRGTVRTSDRSGRGGVMGELASALDALAADDLHELDAAGLLD